MSRPYLSVVIPSYEEMTNLRKGVLEKVEKFLEKKKYSYEVVIVDDGSQDGSIEFVEKFTKENPKFRLIRNQHTGKAGAVTKGILEANGEYILFTDMDQATPIEEVDKVMPFFDKGYDIVIGSRSSTRKGSPLSRLVVSWGSIILRKMLVGMPEIADTQCGFKAFSSDAAKKLFTEINKLHHGFHAISGSAVTSGFDVEFLYIAKKMGYKIKEVPVEWLYVETRRVSPVKDSIHGVLDLIRIRRNALLGKYNRV